MPVNSVVHFMKIILLSLGHIDLPYLKDGISYYEKKLSHYTKLELLELTLNKNKQPKEHEAIKVAEGELILNKVGESDYLVLFDDKGVHIDSIAFSKWIEEKQIYQRGNLIFCIGGAFGFSDDVYQRANYKMSFSKLTFNHQMFKLIALEQLYRAFTILKNEPYHHK